jgi:prepilin-type N-terminal cleavage/methylation domain-containing protein
MRAERSHGAFTLLEVLAAVAVLGLVYSILATSAIQGLRAEGDAGRRLRASLLADQRISDIEAQIAAGQLPAIGETESEADEFVVRIEVKPLDLQIAETKASKRAKERLDRAVAAKPKGPSDGGSFLAASGASKQSMLRRVDLSVSWADGDSEQSVRRTSFGLDAKAALPLIAKLVAAAETEKGQGAQKKATETGAKPGEQTGAAAAQTGAKAGGSAQPQGIAAPSGAGEAGGSAGGDR